MNHSTPISDADREALKQESFNRLPKDLDNTAGQKQILTMLSDTVSPVLVCREKAEREIWPSVEARELPLDHAVYQCAAEADQLIGVASVENLNLEQQDREALLKAWIALEYYRCLLSSEDSRHIRKLQDYLSALLLKPVNEEIGELPPIALNTAPLEDLEPEPETGKPGKTALIVAAAVLLLAAVLVCGTVFDPVAKAEQAIDAIGGVTLNSREAIETAEALFGELSEKKQNEVKNRDILTASRQEYDALSGAVEKAQAAIDAIGTVTLESGEVIKAARAAYDALEAEGLTRYLADRYDTLLQAEADFQTCREQDLMDSARESQGAGRYPEAIAFYETLLDEHPDSASAAAASLGILDCTTALAQAELEQGNLEAAMELLTGAADLGTQTAAFAETYAAVETELSKLRPENGKSFQNNIDWGWGEFTVTADGGSDALLKLESTEDPTKSMTFYVRAGEAATVKVSDGSYILKYTTGSHWYGPDSRFGESAPYTKAANVFTFRTTQSGSYVYYTTISITLRSTSAADLDTAPIPAEEF